MPGKTIAPFGAIVVRARLKKFIDRACEERSCSGFKNKQ